MTSVRPAVEDDDYRIEDVRVAAWRVAYRDLIPPDYFDGWDYDAVIASRRAHSDQLLRFVTQEPSGAVSGFVICGPVRDEDSSGAGEIYSLYVAPRYWGQGQGRLLMAEALRSLVTYDDVLLWVLRDNPRARRFYEKHGFEPDGSARDAALPKRLALPEVRYRLRK